MENQSTIQYEKSGKHVKIGQRIRMYRELNNYTQEHVARELNMSVSGYSRLERNEVSVSIQKLMRIAEILRVNTGDLMTDNQHIIDVSRILRNQKNKTENNHSTNHINGTQPENYREQLQSLHEEIHYLRDLLMQMARKTEKSEQDTL